MTQSNAVATRDEKPAPKAPVAAGGPIAGMVPQDIEQAFRLSTALAQSGDMIPRQFQGKPEAIMAAVLKGAEVGLAPMQALASIAVVNGRPTIYGDGLTSLVFKAGHHLDSCIEGEGERAVAVATLTRGDTGRAVERRFSVEDAKRAGLWGKQGPWQSYPMRMLEWRAKTWAARDGAPDALMGLTLADDADTYGPDAARDVTPAAPKPSPRGSLRYVEPDPEPEPEVDRIHEATGEVLDPDAPEEAPTWGDREHDALAALQAAAEAGNKARFRAVEKQIDADPHLAADTELTRLRGEMRERMEAGS